ncbi:MAG: Fe-S cluster assembly protein SufD [Gammaproteobacteria bacterium]|nr:Fe-S cluster assembly protein SufD [Gammaproteobacteria bacterium]MCP5135185.1 Fe-S cluster assembly protein SufD [Gammaproteobacteria bacterium]
MSATEHFAAQVRASARAGADVAWLNQTREQALASFEQMGLPTTRNEHWKYTAIKPIEKKAFAAVVGHVGIDDIQPFLFEGLDADRMVFVNGAYHHGLSRIASEGVRIASLAAVLADDAATVEPYLGKIADPRASGFAALNTAGLVDGAFVHVERNQAAARPLLLLFVASGNDAFAQPRNLIVADEGGSVSVIEHYVTLGQGAHFTNAVTEISVAANAEVRHYKVQQESDKAFHIATLQADQARNGRLHSYQVSLGGAIARNDVNTRLNGEGAEAEMNGLYLVDGRQHMDFHTNIEHVVPHCISRENYRGVLDGRGRGVFNGKVHVYENAVKTDSDMSNKNLLLSSNAEIDTKPELEIYNDDVKCAHGATIGQLDEVHMFYLRSRGIDPVAARSLLVFAFANEVLQTLPLEAVRTTLEKTLIARLPKADHLDELVQ